MELSREMRERFSKDVELPREMLFGALHEALKKIDGNCIHIQDLVVLIIFILEY
mgnify:CR=1 FL=1